jgi:hypothetical protein
MQLKYTLFAILVTQLRLFLHIILYIKSKAWFPAESGLSPHTHTVEVLILNIYYMYCSFIIKDAYKFLILRSIF